MSTTERIDITINESGGRAVKRSLDDIADSAKAADGKLGSLNASADNFVTSLKRQADILGLTRSKILAYDAAQLKLTETQKASVNASIKTIEAYEKTNSAASKNVDILGFLRSNIVGLVAGYASLNAVISGGKAVIDATIKLQQFNNTLLVGTGSAKGAADAMEFVRSESQRLGLDLSTAADQFAKLTASSRGTALEGKATKDIFTAIAQAATVMGLSADQTSGSLLAIQQMISKGTVSAEELRGQLGERLPGSFQIAARSMNLTTAELGKLLESGKLTAEQLLPRLAAELNKTFGAQSEQSAQGLNAQINRMNTAMFDLKIAIGESGLINFLSSGIELATKLANALTNAFGGGQKLSPIEKQVSLIQTLEKELESLQNLTHIPLIGDLLFDKKQADLLKFRIESATEDLAKMKEQLASNPDDKTVIANATGQAGTLLTLTKKTISESERFIESLNNEIQTAGLTTIQIKRLEAAKLGVLEAATPLIDVIEKENKRINQQEIAVAALVSDLNKYKQITESVMTEQEKFNAQVEELNRLRNLKNGAAISEETYARALKKAREELDGTTSSTRNATDQISQMWIQAGRNIQSSLGNLVFDFFSGGLDNMVKNAGNAVLRIMSEFAGLKIAQTIGLTSLFTAGNAVVGTGASGGGLNLLNAASLGSNAMSLFRGGFGANSLVGGVLSMLPGEIGAFGSGMAGGAIAGVSSPAVMSGASFAEAAGPWAVAAMAALAVDSISKAFAGDKTLGNGFTDFMQKIPVLGAGWNIVAGLFGHGTLKFRQQSLQGTISSDGFDGDITNVFRAKGGLFVGNKHKSMTEQLTPEMQQLFDSTIGGFFNAAHAASVNLGLDAKLVENFTKEIQIKSEKGQKLTEEAITQMLQGISDDIAKAALPVVDEFKKIGETSIQTLSRLSNEFTVLTGAAGLLFNKSSEWSKGFVSSFGFGDRSAFLDKAGGADAFAAMVAGFSQNFLTEDQRMRPVIESLVSQRDKLGLSGINSRDQYVTAVQSGRLNQDQLIFLLKNQEAINQVFVYLDNIAKASPSAAQGLAAVSRELRITDADSTDYGRRLNKSIQDTTSAIAELEGIAKQLMGTVNQINPLSINEARGIVSSGNANDPRLQSALSTLSGMGTDGFGSLIDFQRAKAQNVAAISSLQDSIAGQISEKNRELDQFNFEKLMFQSALQRAAQMYSEAASFDVGGYVPRTGMAIIHKDEQILTPGQQDKITAEIAQMREELGKALAAIAKHTEKTATLIDDVSAGGTAMLTEAA